MNAVFGVLFLVGVALANPMIKFEKKFPERIVGGEAATKGEFPWIVQIQVSGSQYCGGSIVNANTIVTAAHCATLGASRYTIVAGQHNLNQNEASEQERSVSKVTQHPSYNANTLANDVAVMTVSTPFEFNADVAAIELATADPTGNVVVAGWGATSEGGGIPNVLQKVTVPMVSEATCNSNYSGEILAGMICAGTGGKDSCQGDSGGPLTKGSTLVGIVSWGYGCARPGYPGVYTSASYFSSWINNNA